MRRKFVGSDDAGAARARVLDDPLMDNADIPPWQVRKASLAMASAAIRKGATTKRHDDKLDPCGLDEVLETLFGKASDFEETDN